MHANPRIQTFFARLKEQGVIHRLLWSAKRNPRSRDQRDDVFFVSFSGEVKPAINTAVIIDYGKDGFGFFPESQNTTVNDDVQAVLHGRA